jgi:predicted GNAT superfamily acetyltransferase
VADDPAAPVVTGTRVPNARRVILPFLAGAPKVYETDPERCVEARKSFRRAATALFKKGFEVIGVAVRDSGPVYILERR